ncbi:oligosaccharide repeat unit polymerase [Candidatus Saccharibacteria bacterium TM7i]|nr:oligosaccharide repeat unit polymerase [Candidatus Saccharibacteria bacterium TM7i]
MFVIAAFGAALLWATLFAQPTHAQGAAADWNGASLQYDGRQYVDAGKAKRNEFPGISENAPYFTSSSTPSNSNGPQSNNVPRDVYILYFTPGVDPPSAKNAQHVKFTYNPATKTYSNPREQTSVAIQGTPGQNATTCAVEGVGWMVCQISSFLATGMDWVFEAISGFMEVQPLTTSQDSGLYVGWNVMRNIANVAFIIVFLIIVYAQLTGTFAGTYGIKKLLPRLIIAAILVNLSYIICAIAVDLSNIIGYSLQNIFIELRNQIFHVDSETWNKDYMLSWESITGFILSGGTAALGAGVGTFAALAATGGTVIGAIYLLLPALMGLIVAILVVLLILAARQAIITVMILIAPLAFVAYLLPNTEKWFDKWRGLLMTMLIFFPAFAVIFGGSQLAGAIIIQNAQSINILILGMIVQVAPLVITPFLLKFSGSLLGRIAGLVNNPNRGLIDRTRKFADSRAARHRNRGISGEDMKGRPGELRRRNFARQASRWANNFSRDFDEKAKNSQTAADNAYHSSRGYQKIHENAALHDTNKDTVHARNDAHIEGIRSTPGSRLSVATKTLETEKQGLEANKTRTTAMIEKLRADESSELHMNTLRTKAGEATVDQLNNQNARMMEEYKSGKLVRTGEADTLMREMKEATIQANAQKQGTTSAQYETARAFADAMNVDSVAGEALRKVAAGIGGRSGEVRARASAKATLDKLNSDVRQANVQYIEDVALSSGEGLKQYSAGVVTARLEGKADYKGRAIDDDIFAAALEAQAKEKNIGLFEKIRGVTHLDQQLISETIHRNKDAFKGAGGFHLQDDLSLNAAVLGVEEYNKRLAGARIGTLGNVSANNMAGLKFGWVAGLADTSSGGTLETSINNASLPDLIKAYRNVKTALTDPTVRATIGDRIDELSAIEQALAQKISGAGNPLPDVTAEK